MICKICFKDKRIVCRGLCNSCYKQIRYKELSIPTKKCECSPECTKLIPIKNIDSKPRMFAHGHHKKKGSYLTRYKTITAPNHPNAHEDGKIYEHRLIMSEHLGRPLLKGEVVHHKNNNGRDNRIENLEVFVSQKKHISETTRKPPPNVRCEICDSDTTYLDKRQRPDWRGYGGSFICFLCRKLYWQYTCFGNKDLSDYNDRSHLKKDYSNISCDYCGSKETYIRKNGRPEWAHNGNDTICKKCYKRLRR